MSIKFALLAVFQNPDDYGQTALTVNISIFDEGFC